MARCGETRERLENIRRYLFDSAARGGLPLRRAGTQSVSHDRQGVQQAKLRLTSRDAGSRGITEA
jgi:hypothetical protein